MDCWIVGSGKRKNTTFLEKIKKITQKTSKSFNMPYPKTKSAPGRENQMQALAGLQVKKQGNFPMFMCEFFEGFEVLQTQGTNSKEYLWGIYFSGLFCGHVYFGDRWTQKEAAQICSDIMPPTWGQIDEYVILKGDKTSYWKMHPDQYAWIYDRVITKTNN